MQESNQSGKASRRAFLKSMMGTAVASTAALSLDAQARIHAPHELETLQDYEEHWGFCDMCYWRCGLKVRSRDGKAFKIDGNPEHRSIVVWCVVRAIPAFRWHLHPTV